MANTASTSASALTLPDSRRRYNRTLLLVAGLGGLLYGVDVGIIGGALPYLEATSHLTAGQLSIIVAAVLLGSVISTLFAGLLADAMGRKPLMTLSGLAFVISIPIIALSHGYGPLFLGRLLQGISGGFIGVVVPLYLAECLGASTRGKGTGVFQWLLTLGIVSAALIGIYYSYRVEAVERIADAATIFHFKDQAWRRIFWVSLPPGVLFVFGSLLVAESPRWLFRRGNKELAYASLLRSRSPEQADTELHEMEEIANAAASKSNTGTAVKDSLLRRKYVIPFLLACVILFCNTATGVNSIIGYNTSILLQSGLSDLSAHWGYVIFTFVNFLLTLTGMSLVDRTGRRFLFIMGTIGIITSLIGVGMLFLRTEKLTINCRSVLQTMVKPDQSLALQFTPDEARTLMAKEGYTGNEINSHRASLAVIYSYGGFTGATTFVRSDDPAAAPIRITREEALPTSRFEAYVKNPFTNLDAARTAPLKIEGAYLGQVPDAQHGWLVAIGLYLFMSFYAVGPGVCVWLALSELMPTRIRSNGMSIALVINQLVSTTLAAVFLPVVSKYGYSTIFFLFASFTVVYLITVFFFLPETKGKTLEEIEAHFERA
ncbi:MFS transporter [Acidipila rosea]|uniref:Putative MFS family arabinose efflux permease n=1 Tax=Acidipila rosea TaxID=768535 RepID=A0A4V2PUU7_9BACT|nr:MFS transporter [Acidipila rosea]MBW4027960.1 sugar porter family MFS transporter [Acidobacteriota bacterium]MBW4045805.1 sugar porter family MFS transporter [Acidobacteriota bacterium]TCK71871.1 putative MFS family arabinose efflux permease [Acidipila rosea]